MKKCTTVACLVATSLTLFGCSLGDLRAFNDAMSAQNGYTVTYPDQSDTMYVGDVKAVTGIYNGEGYHRYNNTGSSYCKVKVIYEDEDYDFFRLDPYENTSRMYMSIYNQVDYVRTLCGDTARIFSESMN